MGDLAKMSPSQQNQLLETYSAMYAEAQLQDAAAKMLASQYNAAALAAVSTMASSTPKVW